MKIMSEPESFHDTLLRLIAKDERRKTYTSRQLAKWSGVPYRTIANWLQRQSIRPRHWQQVVKLAAAMDFSQTEVDELLTSAGHPSIAELRETAEEEEDKKLLAPWPRPFAPFRADDDLVHFTGREEEISRLEQWFSQEHFLGPFRLAGMAGVGKTALAAHLAHRNRSLFHDIVLWENMDGADLMDTLSSFATDLGYDLSNYRGLSSRSRAFKDILTRKRVLIILDGIKDSSDAGPFLPHTPSTSAVIITTRHRDLGSSHPAYPLYLEQFNPQEAEDLFTKILGTERVQKEKSSLAELARFLGYLPMALDIAAHQIKKRTGSTIVDFLTRLQQAGNRLDYLTDKERSVRALLNTSYDQLMGTTEQQFFAALSTFSGRDFDAKAAAYIARISELRAEDLLIDLRDLSIIQQVRPQRFRLHALINEYARENNQDDHTYLRMAEYFVAYTEKHERDYEAIALEASNIMVALKIARDRQMGSALVRGVNALYYYWNTRGLYLQAITWLKYAEKSARDLEDAGVLTLVLKNLGHFELHRGNPDPAESYLQEGLALAHAQGAVSMIAQILNELGLLLDRAGKFERAETYYLESLALFRELGDLRRTSKLLLGLGGLASDMGQHELGTTRLQEALEIARQLNDLDLMGTIFNNLGAVAGRQGDFSAEESYYKEALTIARQTHNRLDICYRLANLGALANTKGEFTKALDYLEEALEIALEIGHPERTSTSLRLMAEVAIAQDDYIEADALLRRGLSHIEGSDLPISESALLADLGLVMLHHENYVTAKSYFERSASLAKEAEHTWYLADALNKQGEFYLKQGNVEQASAVFSEAFVTAHEAEITELVAEALFGKARLAELSGDYDLARSLGNESLTIFENLGYYKAVQVRKWLSKIQVK